MAVTGLLLLILGVWSFADPEIFSVLYGIETDKASATIALRAVIGGGEIGIGLFLLLGGQFAISVHSRLVLSALVFGCVFFARAGAIILAWPEIPFGALRELAIECGIVLGLTFALIVYWRATLPAQSERSDPG